MQPQCPKCKSVALVTAEGALAQVDASERSLACPSCHGYFLPHRVVEHWKSEPFVEVSDGVSTSMHPELDRKTGLCPLGHGILLRARVEAEQVFYLERCGFCHGVWLDGGEWQRLAASHYLEHLDDLWDPAWQRQRRSEKLQHERDRSLSAQIGEKLYGDLAAVVEPLRDHPARAQALAWITERLDPHGQLRSDLTRIARLAKKGS